MSHYIIELIIAMLLAFFIGCIIGCLLRKFFTVESASETTRSVPAPEERAPAAPLAATVPPPPPPPPVREEPAAAPAPLMGRPERPKGIAQARGGKADNLQRISGVGPKNERVLHNLGFFHFDQIAAWTEEQIAWVDDHLKFNGRIKREEWVKQAQLLAEGRDDEFTRLYGTGGLKERSGEKKSGERTRRS
jgi:NADH-quinone oxidoreductase subunit E